MASIKKIDFRFEGLVLIIFLVTAGVLIENYVDRRGNLDLKN